MNLQTHDETSTTRVASRRNVVRGAAWTTAAVTVVVATPNIAAASPGKSGTLAGVTANPVKYNNAHKASIKHVKWDLVFKNTGTAALSALTIVCTFTEQSPAEITEFAVGPGSWTESPVPTFTASYNGTVLPGGSLAFTPDFKGANNSSGILTVNIYDGTFLLGTVSGSWRPA